MKKGYVYIILTTLFFSSMEISLKTVTNDFNPLQITLSRFFVGGLVLLPFAVKRLRALSLSITKSDLKYFAFLGFMCVVVSMSLYQLAVLNTKASVVAVLFSCNPVFVMLLAYLILKEKIYRHNVISLILEVLGIIVIINPLHTKLTLSGIFLTLSSAIFSMYTVFGKRKTLKFGGIVVTCFSFIFGSLEMLILVLLTKINFIADILNKNKLHVFANIPIFSGYTLHNMPIMIYVFVFVTGVGYALYFMAMEATSTSLTSLVFFFKPVISPILALLILKEIIPINMVIGILLIVIGSIISIIPTIITQMHNKHVEALYKE
ncbi:DMT family transporter [Clostridioides difficile]|uniref:DMT family transporter n=1 Tax=Clostridioides difficile TaxID=1496 RepID=UPI00188B14AD|nr:DMT family transporter [Clostridioides difficile]EJA6628447.1 EamA family transporter [Clostridioides difficile]MBF4775473.1 EamA family transporter [Clostridioides difficile]MBZ0749822.1 DMT family transporter [Clostridioides difficile]MDV9385668.1 DMT family transporter [Clostridioides difficile]HBG2499337.1 EamA family transporter [Clostridioides difficile]